MREDGSLRTCLGGCVGVLCRLEELHLGSGEVC